MAQQVLSLEELVQNSQKITRVIDALEIIGGLSFTTKMPCASYNIPAEFCRTGSRLRKIKGSICSDCYACEGESGSSGWYTKDRVQQPMVHRLLQVLFNPRWTDAMNYIFSFHKWPFFRWHDSGDIQDMQHLRNIVKIAITNPYTKFWLPTQEWEMIIQLWEENGRKPLKELFPNLIIRLSARMKSGYDSTSLAKMLGCAASRTSFKIEEVDCPAHTHGNTCGNCRNCWDYDKIDVTYKLHVLGEGKPSHDPFIIEVKKYLDALMSSGITEQAKIYRQTAEYFSLPIIKVRVIMVEMRKKYLRNLKVLSGTYVNSGRPRKLKILS